MKTKKIITVVAVALTFGMIYTGCKKEEDTGAAPSAAEDTTSESDNSTGESSFSEIFKSLTEISNENSSLRTSCATITIDTTVGSTWPKTVTIDYGTGSTCSGKKGKLKAVFTGQFGAPGTIITITDSNYYHGGNKINVGVHTVNCGNLIAGHKTFNISVGGGHVMMSGGNVTWNSTRSIKWIAGDTTLDPMDDVYEITGSTTGMNRKGDMFSSTITTPLIMATNCPWIESGVITVTTTNGKTRSIDFGTGACDNLATITTSNGQTVTIHM